MYTRLQLLLACLVAIASTPPVFATDFGTTGLIDVPSAFMAEDGNLRATIARHSRTDSYALTYQLTPWAETTFRYTKYYSHFFYDRNYELKLRLIEESYYSPQVAIGIRDLIGTGAAGSEYLVASKTIGNIEITGGIGWGELAGDSSLRNPLTYLDDRFGQRSKAETGAGIGNTGQLQPNTFFSGESIGFFGGIAYKFDSLPAKVHVERNPNQYPREVLAGARIPESVVSWGLEYEPFNGLTLAVSRQNLESWGFRIALDSDTTLKPPKRATPEVSSDFAPSWINENSWYDKLLFSMENSGLFLFKGGLNETGETAYLVIGNRDYPMVADAISRATELADLHLPPKVETIVFTVNEFGHPVINLKIARPSSLVQKNSSPIDYYAELNAPKTPTNIQHLTGFYTGKTMFDFSVANRLYIFDPDAPLLYQFFLKAKAIFALSDSLNIVGEYAFDIYNQFEQIKRKSNSTLPRVRSDLAKYLKQGDTGLESLYLDKRGNINDNSVYFRAFAGVLEEMYSGIGGELLYQPYKSRVAFGASLNWVKKRDFDRSLNHRGYHTVTGFASVYWATPFYNYDAAVHAGRYLAKDIGATFEVRRTFDSGWSLGAWATFTDVPFDEFGEGSFDKGFFFNVPLDSLYSKNTRASYKTRIRPVQRDGGQRLEDFSGSMWFDMRQSRFDAFSNNKERMRAD